jgi:hypothetical protein
MSGDFNEGKAAVQKNGKWGYINNIGQEVTPCIYSNLEDLFKI